MVETAGGGAVVNISSRASDMVQTGFVAYGAAKAALNIADPESRRRVRAQGARERDLGGRRRDLGARRGALEPEVRARLERNTPMGRLGQVEDIAACALYLASPAAGWVTGKVFQVDGGVEAPAIQFPTRPL